MESLQIRTGEISLMILDDDGYEKGIFKFNPTDIESAKRFVALEFEFKEKQHDFNDRADQCTTPEEQLKLLDETVLYFESVIDSCFGEGSSKLLFGDAKTLSMFSDFLDGIIPYYEQARKNRLKKYDKATKK